MPVKERYEPMVIKVLVTKTDNKIGVGTWYDISTISISVNSYKYSDMEQEYNETGKISTQPKSNNINLTPYYNLKIKDTSKVLITDDIDYFRDQYKDCLFKPCDDNITDVIYSKCSTTDSPWFEVDWGDGIIEYHECVTQHFEHENFSYDRLKFFYDNVITHSYQETGEYYITVRGKIPNIKFMGNFSYDGFSYKNPIEDPNIRLIEVVRWGNLSVYSISGIFESFYTLDRRDSQNSPQFKFKMPKHVSSYSFKNVLSANRAFVYLDMNENEFSHEIIFDFVKTFPNLLSAGYMFGETKISYIPQYFCNNHKNIMDCSNMFHNCPITRIESFAFANCSNLSQVSSLTYSSCTDGFQPLITTVEDSIFENDINLVEVFGAFNYVNYGQNENGTTDLTYTNDKIGLKTVGNNIYKNCKRLRFANEPFYQQGGLVSVGESMFEGCDDLIDVSMCFYKCFSLQSIGKNIFKGCSKLRVLRTFLYENYVANLPDNMFYDLKYYDYLKGMFNEEGFNGYWTTIQENNGEIQQFDGSGNELSRFLKYKGFNHENFPTRKHSNNIFSETFIQESVQDNSFFTVINKGNTIFKSLITFNNTVATNYYECISISNFTGKAFPIWEYTTYLQSLSDSAAVFGFRNIKVKKTYYKKTDTGGYEESGGEYGVTINYYNNYTDIAAVDPLYYDEKHQDKYKRKYWAKDKLLQVYYFPDEYETETEKQEVLEFNDPVEEREWGT